MTLRYKYIGQGYCTPEDEEVVKRAGLIDISILCSADLMKNMRDEEIDKEAASGDYDANHCHLNLFLNNACIEFVFDLFGLHVSFNAMDIQFNLSHREPTFSQVMTAIEATAAWFSKHSIEDISEKFYIEAEQGVCTAVLNALTQKNFGTGVMISQSQS